jgi:oligopeptide transport system substrate-binding protein
MRKSILTILLFSLTFALFAKDFVIVESDRPHDLDPHTTSFSSDAEILTGLYEGLFSYNPVSLEPQYALCIDYRISRDKKRMTFKLRQDARFSNGEVINAQSVKDSWMKLLSTPNAPYSSMLDIIRGARAFRLGQGKAEDVGIFVNDDYTLSVYLTGPANYLPKVLCHSSFSVVHRLPTVYSGPFEIENMDQGLIVLAKNPYYWDLKNVASDQIIFYQSDDAEENTWYFNTGAADWVYGSVFADKIYDKKALQFNAEFATSYFFFKTSAKKSAKAAFNPWDYEEFRNAILEAMPWDILRSPFMVSAPTLVYPMGDYPTVDGFSYTDPVEAKNLMAMAREKYGIPADTLIPLVLDITEGAFSPEQLQALQDAFAPLGLDFQVNFYNARLYFDVVASSNSDIFSYTWIGDFADPLAFLMLFQGNSTLNESGWQNDEYDSLIEKAASVDAASRSAILAQAEQILLDSGIIMPLYHPISFNVIDLDEAGGWALNAFDLHPLKYLYRKEKTALGPDIVLANE